MATITGNGHEEYADAEDFIEGAAADALELPDSLKGWFPNEYVVAILGHRRSGKTTLMAHHLLKAVKRGLSVYTNLDIYPEKLNVPLEKVQKPLNLDDLLSFDVAMSEAVIGIEEIGTWVETMRAQSNTNILLSKFFQLFIGKQKLRIFFTNQSEHLPWWIWQQIDMTIHAHDMFYTEWGRDNNLAKGTSFYYIAKDTSGIFTGQPGFVWTFGLRKANQLWDKFNSYQQFDPYLWARKTRLVGEEKVVDMDTGQMFTTGEYGMEQQQRQLTEFDTYLKAEYRAWGNNFVELARANEALLREEPGQVVMSLHGIQKAMMRFKPGSKGKRDAERWFASFQKLETDSKGGLARIDTDGRGHRTIVMSKPLTEDA